MARSGSQNPYYAPPADPAERICEFCEQTAIEVIPITPGKLYVYACGAHIEQAAQSVTGRRADSRRRTKPDQSERLFDPGKLEEAA